MLLNDSKLILFGEVALRRAPPRISPENSPNEVPDLGIDSRAFTVAALPAPVVGNGIPADASAQRSRVESREGTLAIQTKPSIAAPKTPDRHLSVVAEHGDDEERRVVAEGPDSQLRELAGCEALI